MVRVRDFVDARLYHTEEDVVQDALRHLLRARPDFKVRLAVHRYETENLSVAKAASLAGVSWAQMKEILIEYHVPLRLGADSIEAAEQEAQALRTYFQDAE
jgi:predicted HTH domain antitoxin